ncbi:MULTISPECIES: helix-turn-helix domain-containing protein [Neobacillus]|jgi:ribosome-binding protein aMBF1 (putative translation factor)|uniref:helix-turn-helix domain-containing protein n=1 Tax=Neobacillus TaxID=2675232 RepID=UPI0013D76885|nr:MULTISPECIES: helix-turn-helix transcriptional regulator [Neobacillus]MED3623229.1 helix-turn-helix transcriptional regulator [Neobacillus thermocopriae]MED3714409.1 helix-turn-helix transcriptional regulator [Neobacillus thermocopriae]
MQYHDLLKKGIEKKGLSLTQISFRLAKKDICLDKSVISKLQNGKIPPARDEINIALAEILDLDIDQFRIAAAKEILPKSLYELIKTAG